MSAKPTPYETRGWATQRLGAVLQRLRPLIWMLKPSSESKCMDAPAPGFDAMSSPPQESNGMPRSVATRRTRRSTAGMKRSTSFM